LQEVDWLISPTCHIEFEKYVAECSVKIKDITDIQNVNKLFDEQILIFESMK
jgi:hypothetical protein